MRKYDRQLENISERGRMEIFVKNIFRVRCNCISRASSDIRQIEHLWKILFMIHNHKILEPKLCLNKKL